MINNSKKIYIILSETVVPFLDSVLASFRFFKIQLCELREFY